MEPGDVETMTITSAAVEERGAVEDKASPVQAAFLADEDGDEDTWPAVLTTKRKDIHTGPPPKQVSTVSSKPPENGVVMDRGDEQEESAGNFRRGSTGRQAVGRGKITVLKHDLETESARRGRVSPVGSVDRFEDNEESQLEEITPRLTPKAQTLNVPQLAATGSDREEQAASSFRRARSFVEKGNRTPGRDIDYNAAHMETAPNSSLRRQVDQRRSYSCYKSRDATSSHFQVVSRGRDLNRPLNTGQGSSGQGGKFVAGFYPAGNTETQQLRLSTSPTRRRTPLRATHRTPTGKTSSEISQPPDVPVAAPQGPPPPTPATGFRQDSQAMREVMIPNGYEHHQERAPRPSRSRDKSGWRPAKRSPIENGMDYGVSNTSQMLLESQMRKQTFSFPEISVEEQRKALGSPRMESTLLVRRRPPSPRSPTRSPTRQVGTKRSSSKEGYPEGDENRDKLPTLDGHHSQSSINHASESNAENIRDRDPTVKEHISTLAPRAGCKELNGSIVSLNSESSKKTTLTSNRDRYSRMIAMGLPRVNLDIEKNHFSRQSIKRRSQKLRERYDMPSDDGSVAGPVGMGFTRSEPPGQENHVEVQERGAPSQPPPSVCRSMVGASDAEDTDAMWPGQGGDMESVILKTYEANQVHHNQIINGGLVVNGGAPPLTSAPKEISTTEQGPGRETFQRQTTVKRGKNKNANYTYFKMMPPGQIRCSGERNTIMESPRTAKALYQSAA